MAQLVKYTGEIVDISPANGSDFKFEGELYPLLETNMIEVITLPDGRLMLLDEEGKLKDSKQHQINIVASWLLIDAGGMPGDVVIGHVVICDDNQLL